MGAKVIIWMFGCFGIPAYIFAWLLKIGIFTISDPKEFILYTILVLFSTARLIVYCVESYQRIKFRQRKLKGK